MSTDTAESQADRAFSGMTPNPEMSMFGYLMAALLLVVLLPLLPFLALAYILYRLGGGE